MKKYFMTGTNNEVKFGDMLELDSSKDMEDGTVCHRHLECRFIPDIVESLLDGEIIEEKEIAEEGILDFSEDDPLEELTKAMYNLDQKVCRLEEKIQQLASVIASQFNSVKSPKDDKKPSGK